MSALVEVRTQGELDDALTKHRDDSEAVIHIVSDPGVWLHVNDTGECIVEAWGSATVRAGDRATVEAWGSATVEAGGSATVRAGGSATVGAWGSATVEAWGSATVRANPYVAIYLHSAQATVSGGVLIDLTKLDETNTADWLAYNGMKPNDDGSLILYKAVNDALESEYSRGQFAYSIGSTVTPARWDANSECGNGIHLCPTPFHAFRHYRRATRFLACEAQTDDMRCIDWTKAKVPAAKVLYEVDLDGNRIGGDAA